MVAIRRDDAKQADFDDPAVDRMLPWTVLARTRAALDWMTSDAGVEVTEPAAASSGRNVTVGRSFAFDLPTRYLPIPSGAAGESVTCARVSLAATDGVEYARIGRADPSSGIEAFEDALRRPPPGWTILALRVEREPGVDGGMLAYRRSATYDGTVHSVHVLFQDATRRRVAVTLEANACVPAEELRARADGIVASYRPLDIP